MRMHTDRDFVQAPPLVIAAEDGVAEHRQLFQVLFNLSMHDWLLASPLVTGFEDRAQMAELLTQDGGFLEGTSEHQDMGFYFLLRRDDVLRTGKHGDVVQTLTVFGIEVITQILSCDPRQQSFDVFVHLSRKSSGVAWPLYAAPGLLDIAHK